MGTHASDPAGRIAALVEAFHPDGAADVVVVGSGDKPADLVLTSKPRDISLTPDGVAWVRVPPGRRYAARRALARGGFVVHGSWLAVPRVAPLVLIRLAPRISRSAFAAAVPGRLGRIVGRGGAWLEELLPGVALLAQRPAARAPFAWARDHGADAAVAVFASWHDPLQRVIVRGDATVVKSSRGGDPSGLPDEAEIVSELAPTARAAGAAVPTVVYAGRAGKRIALIEDLVPGERAATLLRRRPDRLPHVVGRVAEWLERWHLETRVMRPLEEHDVERYLLAPARSLAGELPDGTQYLRDLSRRSEAMVGRSLPFAAAHNDLTTWNILLDGEKMGIVDWEAAEREALPLVDLDYLVVDAVAAARRMRRDIAFAACAGSGPDAQLARRIRHELKSASGIDEDVAELARHACWLGHARNEAARAQPGAPRPFLSILAAVVAA
jgi:hypothetical protein